MKIGVHLTLHAIMQALMPGARMCCVKEILGVLFPVQVLMTRNGRKHKIPGRQI